MNFFYNLRISMIQISFFETFKYLKYDRHCEKKAFRMITLNGASYILPISHTLRQIVAEKKRNFLYYVQSQR